jgi:hypothetical protein
MENISYFFRRKFDQIRNIIRWIPIIWKQYDFDYHYALEVFEFKLLRMAEFLESNKAHTLNAKHYASRIRMVVRLMEKVYDDEYAMEYSKQIEDQFGDWDFKFIQDEGKKYGTLTKKWKVNYSEEEIKNIEKIEYQLMKESQAKQERAQTLLWKLVDHNIRHWWD